MNEKLKTITFTRALNTRHQVAPYEQKFSVLIKAIAENESGPVQQLLIMEPWVIGDTYEEIVESLSRLAGSNLNLAIVRRETPVTNN